jgi:type II secretory pathway pseudopilin PulG
MKIFHKKPALLVGLILVVMVGVALAAIAPRHMTYRGAARYYTVNCGAVDADADYIIFVAPYPGRVTRAWLTSVTGLTAADTLTNYRDFSIISKGTAGAGADTLVTYTTNHHPAGVDSLNAFEPYYLGAISTSKNYMSAKEVVVFRNDESTTCTSLGNASITIEFMPDGANAPIGTPTAVSDQ